MATVCYQLDTHKEKKGNTYPIKSYTKYKNRILISTGFCVTPRTQTSVRYSREAKGYRAKNAVIHSLTNRVEMLIAMLDNNQKLRNTSSTVLRDYVSRSIRNESACETSVACLDEFIGTKTKGNTIELYKAAKNKILVYGPAYIFETITKRWLESFNK